MNERIQLIMRPYGNFPFQYGLVVICFKFMDLFCLEIYYTLHTQTYTRTQLVRSFLNILAHLIIPHMYGAMCGLRDYAIWMLQKRNDTFENGFFKRQNNFDFHQQFVFEK
jgi:hypothetical protein